MADMDDRDTKKQGGMGNPRKLELKKTVETGQVRQSFAHGRSKMVTVEVRKKRTYTPDVRTPGGGGRADDRSGGGRGDKSRDKSAPAALTSQEKATRVRALQDAMRAEEDRQAQAAAAAAEEALLAAQEAERLRLEAEAEAEAARIAAEEAASAEARQQELEAEQPAASLPAEAQAVAAESTTEAQSPATPAPADATVTSPDQQTPPAPAAEGAPAAPPAEGAAAEKPAEGTEEDAEAKRARRLPRPEVKRPEAPGRRDDAAGRRSGKLTLTDALDDSASERVRSLASVRRAREKERLKQLQMMRAEAPKIVRDVVIPETMTVQELANRMAERSTDVIKSLMKMGVMATINHVIDADTAELLVSEFGHHARRVSAADVEIGMHGEADEPEQLKPRPPVVTIMGHVDHGKTSLLDALRQTDVAAHEAGGITQHIGAYQLTLPSGDKITFIDTPGHEAFTQMRARGAKVTDIVVLVVAADDGVMPQTVEAINHAKAAGVPIIIAINKIDRPDATPQRIRTELLQYGIQVEGMGGETLDVEVSAKTGANLDKLSEAILLQAELLDLKANPDRPAEGIIVETKVERGRGNVATVLVRRGTLQVGDIFVAGSEWGRVRGLMDASGASVVAAGPGMPVEILGLNGMPAAGDDVVVVPSEGRAREITEFRQRRTRDAKAAAGRSTFEQLFDRIQQGEGKELPVVIKADVHGSAEAIVGALEKLSSDQVKVSILHTGVGGINETDVGLAHASNAVIIGFNVRANPHAREQAKRDGVEIRYYSIIYELADDIRTLLTGMLSPILRENILGYAEIREVFAISKVGKVAGCRVTEGVVRRGAKVRLLRDNVVIHEGDLSQLKHFKEDAKEIREGFECGIALANYQDIQVGDRIECFEIEEIARRL